MPTSQKIIWQKDEFKQRLLEIREIRAEDCWPIRQKVMWPDRSLEYVKLEKDEEGLHLGLFKGTRLISIISVFVEGDRAQFRKFATLVEEQGKGYGSKLLSHLLKEVETYPIASIFCNARIERTTFYEKFGLQQSKHTFEKGGRSYVIMEKYLDNHSVG